MKTIFILVILQLLFPIIAQGKLTATVVKFKGTVLYNGAQINKDTKFFEDGIVEVKEKSYLKLIVKEYNSTFAISPNSKLKIKFNKDDRNSPFTLANGLLRWATKRGKAKIKGFIRSRSVSLAVRGTEFLVVVNELLGETEIYCFSGEVIMQNRKKREDRGIVKKNDWGGIGGRFGKDVGEIVPMTEEQIEHVKTLVE